MLTLPELPPLELELIGERSDAPTGFLALRRYDLTVARGAHRSAVFRYDVVERRALDAAVIAAHHAGPDGRPHVYLRSSLRPPLSLRRDDRYGPGHLWELPAGLIEPDEEPRAAAARELEEELGFRVDASSLEPLGPWALPAPGMIAEVHWFFHVAVDPDTRREPGGDGSPLEEGAVVVSVPVDAAIDACARGAIRDEKTELVLRRLADRLARPQPPRAA